MAFTEITVLEVDYAHMQECSENEVIVPYILSNIPPGEWKNYFEKQAPASASVKISGNTACFKCQKDKAALRKYGTCWNAVTDLVEDANRYYLGVELRRHQELGRQAERERQEEQPPSEFEIEWDRYMIETEFCAFYLTERRRNRNFDQQLMRGMSKKVLVAYEAATVAPRKSRVGWLRPLKNRG